MCYGYFEVISLATIRVKKTREYVVMSNKHLRERRMSLKAKGLLSLMLSLPEDWDYSIAGLCVICKESQTAIRSTLKELEEFQYLVRERQQDEKGQFIYNYTVYELPHNGNLHAVEEDAEDRHAENHTQLNKDKLNIKELNKEELNKDIYKEFEEELSIVVNKELKELYLDYIEMRKSIDSPISARGLKMLIQRCERLSNMNIRIQKLLLETAIINNWKSVYAPSEKEMENINKAAVQELKEFYGME